MQNEPRAIILSYDGRQSEAKPFFAKKNLRSLWKKRPINLVEEKLCSRCRSRASKLPLGILSVLESKVHNVWCANCSRIEDPGGKR